MGVLKPRNRMISLRLSEEEYCELMEISARLGARSTSDVARAAIFGFLARHDGPEGRLRAAADLDLRVAQLQSEVRRLSHLLDNESARGPGAKR